VGPQLHALAALFPGKPLYQFNGWLGRPQRRPGGVRKTSPPPGFNPLTVQSLASRYTDYAVPAHTVWMDWLHITYTIQYALSRIEILCFSPGTSSKNNCTGPGRFKFLSRRYNSTTQNKLLNISCGTLYIIPQTSTVSFI
jgi:hypothetical protein